MSKELYGRAIILKNCGRFLNIASDFGSEYKTHPFLTEQMVYAGLTRENELMKQEKFYVEKGQVPEEYNFEDHYNLPTGVCFTCGYLLDDTEDKAGIELGRKTRANSDINDFNSIDERKAGVQEEKRLPKYGNIEWILPNNQFLVFALAEDKNFLEKYFKKQIFYMGKKRTMFQIEELSEVVKGQFFEGKAELFLPIQVGNQEIEKFTYYEILTVTQRYILIKGKTKSSKNYKWELDFRGIQEINLPSFFISNYLE